MRVFDFNVALTRAPGRSVVRGLSTQAGPAPTYEGVQAEHHAYLAALQSAGVGVTQLPPLEDFPDSVFVEDPALVFTEAAILLRPGAPSRAAEAPSLLAVLQQHFPRVLRLTEGHADGGDVLVTPDRILIGLSSRTDATGAAALRTLLHSLGKRCEIVAVPPGTLHLKTDCSLIDEETVLATPELAAAGVLRGLRVLLVPPEERAAANALRVNDVLLLPAGCPRTYELAQGIGVKVVALPTREISRIDAGLSCMSLRWFAARPSA